MSVSRTSHNTPRSSASQGRIVTANSALSAQLRGDSEGVVFPASHESAVNLHALNVVSPDLSVVNNSSSNTNNTTDRDKVEYVVVSKSRLDFNTNSEANDNNTVLNNPNSETSLTSTLPSLPKDHTDQQQSVPVTQQLDNLEKDSIDEHSRGDLSNRYNYYSLKRSGNVSRISTNSKALINKTQQESGLNGGGSNSFHGAEADSNANSITAKSNVDEGRVNDVNGRSASNLRSHCNTWQTSQRKGEEETALQKNSTDAQQSERHLNDHSLKAQQHTRLSFYSQQDQVREPHSVDVNDQSVPPLDLSRLSGRKSQASDSDSDPISPTPQTVQYISKGQNLHASDRKSPLLHFTPHDYQRTARTYEVDTPISSHQLPHVKSSANFSGPPDTFRDLRGPGLLDPDTYRAREDDRPSKVGSDLADDLRVPYQFDTQAQETRHSYHDKPPSPPVPNSPPPEREPATSLRNNSQVYAVANPEILQAQGIKPPPNNHFTPRQYSNTRRGSESGVRFDSASKHRHSASRGQSSPVRDRAPTPYNRSPPRSPGEYQSRSASGGHQGSKPGSRNTQGLPPQHPPLDTKHRHSAKTDNRSEFRDNRAEDNRSDHRSKLDDSASVKRVYVESPTFTRQEEEEYRFVNSRLEDTEEKEQATFREMDRKKHGHPDRGHGKSDHDRNRDRGDDYYERKPLDQDRYSDKNRDRFEDRNNDRYDDRNHDGYDDRNRGRFEDGSHEMNGYAEDRNRDRLRDERNDRYDYRDGNRYEDRNRYDPYNSQYERLKDDRARYDREPYREEDPDFRQGYRKQNTELDRQELRKEQEYQQELKHRIEKQKVKESDYVPPQHERGGFNRGDNFPRDSLDYPDDRDKGITRDSLDYNNDYMQQNQEWGDPPQNPYQDKQDQYYPNEYEQQNQQQYMKEDSKPAFYDPEDAARMEVVNPKQPKYDYINNNKQDYGVPPRKTYRDIILKKKEEEEKLDKVFVTPKVPSKQKKKKAQSAQPEHMGHQPPVQDQYPLGFKPSSAEELWAMRSNTLQNQSAGSKKGKGSASKPVSKKWNSNPNTKQNHNYQAPPPLPNQGQAYKPPNMHYPNSPNGSIPGGTQGYTTPTRPLQPIENKPAPPVSTEYIPTAVDPNSPFKRHMELKPISQEIVTDDGQRISVDINLRLVSPPPGQGNSPPPGQQHQQLGQVPIQETQIPGDYMRPIGVPYTMQDQYGYDPGFQAYQEEVQDGFQGNGTLALEGKYGTIEDQIAQEHMALAEQTGNTGYAKRFPPGSVSYRDDESIENHESGYTAMYHKSKSKDPNEKPWYKVYDIHDYKKMQHEVRLNRGTLGPDLDTEPYKEKVEKHHKKLEYARMVMEKNKMELGSKKPPAFPKTLERSGEENVKRKAALDYARTVPKPAVKVRPNQYNSYEVAAQLGAPGLSPKTRRSPTASKETPPPKTVDVIDIHSLEQRHLQERRNADKIRKNMEGAMSQKAH